MDELEFQKRVLAQPNDIDSELKEFANEDSARAQFIKDSEALDEQIKAALDVPVPDDFASRILAHTQAHADDDQVSDSQPMASVSHIKPKQRTPWYLAIAAMAMLGTGAFVYQQTTSQAGLGEHALAHIYHEMNSLSATESVSIDDVNKLLAKFGGTVDSLPGEVTYLRYCDFEGKQSVHLVFQSQSGPVTVFFVPKNKVLEGSGPFKDQRFEGRISKFPAGEAVLVAQHSAPVDLFQEQLNGAVRWN